MKKIIAIFISLIFSSANSGTLLVTVEEMNASNSASSPINAKSVPEIDAPIIEISTPKLSTYVSSPTSIELKFQPTPPSRVKAETFKVLYGSFEIDITKRLLNLAKVSELGVLVQDATLPKGKHKLLMVIEDTAGRKGNKAIEFEVK
jgi:hypothetical protein